MQYYFRRFDIIPFVSVFYLLIREKITENSQTLLYIILTFPYFPVHLNTFPITKSTYPHSIFNKISYQLSDFLIISQHVLNTCTLLQMRNYLQNFKSNLHISFIKCLKRKHTFIPFRYKDEKLNENTSIVFQKFFKNQMLFYSFFDLLFLVAFLTTK